MSGDDDVDVSGDGRGRRARGGGPAPGRPEIPNSMRAWVRETYGPAEGVCLQELPTPRPGRGEVLLRVRATALNAGDVRLLRGDPLLVRLVYGLTRPRFPVRGMDVSGTVVALGAGVGGIGLGGEVVAELRGGGGLAEYATVPADRLAIRPAGVDAALAACVPVAAGTAWQAWDAAGLATGPADGVGGSGGRVLVLGASGGVGTFAVQMAILRGAEVWATCGERSRELVEGLGATRVFDHRAEGEAGEALDALAAASFDAVVDIAGRVPVRRLQRLVRDGGRVVLVTGDGGRVLGPVPRMIRAALCSIGSRRRAVSLAAQPHAEITRDVLSLMARGRIAPVVEREAAFAQAGEALVQVSGGHVRGKVVVRVADGA
ncbi:NAD(P)-dependent alcohol dehydrogenase [Streptomyces sp. MS2A]|nr:NAD(P)-dependent alcohol dehydrogenase [Streptomyces sp. MS2A]